MRKPMIVSAVTILLLVFCAPVSGATCESLRSLSLPNITVTAAETLDAGLFTGPQTPFGQSVPLFLPKRCRVTAVAAPSTDSHIEMELWMPLEAWNGKFEAVGNGGWAGVITYGGVPQGIARNMAAALIDGYATSSTDTGHRNDGTAGRFAVGHPEKLIDFAYRAVHEMTMASKALIAAFYGSAPKLSYWNGCSTGGRQGLLEAQRYPDDFDGIVAGAPANNWTHLMIGIVSASQAAHKGQPGNLPKEKLKLLHDSVVAACDRLDGVRDGVLQDPRRCTFDVNNLLCKGEEQSCLTGEQVAAAQTLYRGARTADGRQVYPGLAYGSELGWDPDNGLQPFGIAESYFKDVVYTNSNWDYRTVNIDRDAAAADRVDNGLITAVDPNLQRFFAHGGKLIQYHGWNDQQISPFNSINYYTSVEARLGHAAVDKSYRLFMAPGMMHCGNGDGPDQFNPMAALERWREKEIAPNMIVASHVSNGVIDATQPLCPYPQTAIYNGSGSTRDAANYTCKVLERSRSSR